MNHSSPFGPSSGSTPELPSQKGQAKPVPGTLSEFLLADKVSARRFVQLRVSRPSLLDEDLARSHEILNAQPAKLGKVVELARAAANAVPLPGVLVRWCEEVVRNRDEALRGWALDPSQDARTAFDELLTWASANLGTKKNRAKRQIAESCLLVGLSLLMARRSLAPLDALRSIASTWAGRREERRTGPLGREASRLLVRANVKQLLDLAWIVAVCEGEISSAEDACRSAVASLDDLRHEKAALEASRHELGAKLKNLDRELAKRDSRTTELMADLEGVRTRALQDVSDLKARFRRQIGEGLSELLTDAWDAIDTDPPHPDVARERLEVARETIKRELEWLNKSSG